MQNLKCSSALILRSPLYSFCNYSPEKLKDFLTDPYFIMGVYLASPGLYTVLENAHYDIRNLNQKQQLSLAKYFNRIHYRPTPFGSFSALSVTQWGQHSTISLSGLDHLIFHINWDQEIALKLSLAYINENWMEDLLHINHTLYEVKDEYRYIRTHFNFDTRTVNFSLEALYADPLIKEVLSLIEPTKTGQQLLNILCKQLDFRPHEAHDYLYSLLETQLILPSSHPRVLGVNGISNKVLSQPVLNFPNINEAKKAQNDLNNTLVNKHLSAAQHSFYANTYRPANGGLNVALQSDLLSAIDVLSKIQPLQLPSALKLFIDAFKARYDLEEVPLLKALDPETGIDYANLATKAATNDLLDDLNFSSHKSQPDNINWLAMHKLLLRKWNISNGEVPEINLSFNEPEIVEQGKNTINMPPSVAVMFRVLKNQILLESAGGVTGCALIGRFANFNQEVENVAREITTAEKETNPHVIFAEVGQLSGMHVDNINKRPHLYNYEIPVNTISALPPENQIHLNDLYISVRQNRLIIRSKKLNKEIIPRLTSAYNYNHSDLALFRFLCDMQHQGIQSNLGFNIKTFFPGLSMYPRIKLGNVIISPAKWLLNEEEIIKINTSVADLTEIRSQKNWPQYIALTQNDEQLVFNLKCDADISLFQLCINRLKNAEVQEYFLPDEQSLRDHNNQPVVNQFIAFFTNTQPSYNFVLPDLNNKALNIDRDFSLGSEWLYLKIYLHEHSANNLLANKLLSLLSNWEIDIIKKWFFVRYADPKSHIRLRIQVESKYIGQIIRKLNSCLNDSIRYNIIQSYQADMYRRELERYSELLIEEVETVFYHSSKLICQYIKQLNAVPNTFSYYSLAIITTHKIICLFNDFISDKISFTNTIAKSLYQEFSNDKNLQVSLDQKYRLMKPEIEQLLTSDNFYHQLNLNKELDAFTEACICLKNRASNINFDQKIALVADIIHMHLNRIFFEQQRKQELCIYYMLHKYFTTQKALSKNVKLAYSI